MSIRSFQHKGLQRFYETGSKAGIQPAHAKRLRVLLTALNAAGRPDDMDLPGYRFHVLQGDRSGVYSVKVNGNWRLTFRFVGADAELVNYEDYH